MSHSFVPPEFSSIRFDELSDRQQEIILLISRGWSQRDIADHFGTSSNTVRNQIAAIYTEIGVSNRVQALRWALEQPDAAELVLDDAIENSS